MTVKEMIDFLNTIPNPNETHIYIETKDDILWINKINYWESGDEYEFQEVTIYTEEIE